MFLIKNIMVARNPKWSPKHFTCDQSLQVIVMKSLNISKYMSSAAREYVLKYFYLIKNKMTTRISSI